MKPVIRIIMLVLSVLCLPTLAGPPDFNLTPDVSIKLTLLDEQRSGRSRKHDTVHYKVDEDILDRDGNVLIRKGTPAFGTVLNSRRAGMFGRRGALDISVEYTTAVDGQRVNLRANKEKRGGGDKGLVTAGAILVALPLALLKGSNVSIDAGTTFIAYVNDSLRIKTETTSRRELMPVKNREQVNSPMKSIKLKNGEQVSGKLLSLQNGIYVVQTSMGELRIKEGDVASIVEQNQKADEVQKEKSSLEKKLEELRSKHK